MQPSIDVRVRIVCQMIVTCQHRHDRTATRQKQRGVDTSSGRGKSGREREIEIGSCAGIWGSGLEKAVSR